MPFEKIRGFLGKLCLDERIVTVLLLPNKNNPSFSQDGDNIWFLLKSSSRINNSFLKKTGPKKAELTRKTSVSSFFSGRREKN